MEEKAKLAYLYTVWVRQIVPIYSVLNHFSRRGVACTESRELRAGEERAGEEKRGKVAVEQMR